MVFNRPPRIQTALPDDTIKIPGIKNPPTKPSKTNWFTVAFPLAGVVITVVIMLVSSGGSGGGLSYLMFIPVMLASYLATVATSAFQKRKYEKQLDETKSEFRNELRITENRLNSLQEEQIRIKNEKDPTLEECLKRAKEKDPRLGERRVTDFDFLAPRLGVGDGPTSLNLEPIDMDIDNEDLKKELEFAEKLYQAYITVPNVPITARLEYTGSIGFSGSRAEVLKITRAFICHLATHHWPSEVQIGAIGNDDKNDWKWTEKLPHSANFLLSSSSKDQISARLKALEVELQNREQYIETQKEIAGGEGVRKPTPRVIIIMDYLGVETKHTGLSKLLAKGSGLGIYGIFLANRPEEIPGECGASIEVTSQKLSYKETGTRGSKAQCRPDKLGLTAAKNFANQLALIEWPSGSDGANPPSMVTFLEMFGVDSVEELQVEKWWDEGSPYGYLRAPIGRLSATSDLIFDFNDTDGAHGPHGLLGGMTGSGKSEVLKTILLAFATTHHPYDLNFALIDYKGGAAFNELAKLPHTVGVVTNIEDNASFAERVILALSGEIERRERILENARKAFKFGRSHVNDYRKLPVKQPLPHLIIVFDEFAEFKQRHPEESKRLISIARKGRSLGVHLVLATQNIQSAVDPEILQNSSFRICLKVSETQDSMQMIGIPDAVNLIRGRGYLSSDSRQLFQAAYAGASYIEKSSNGKVITKIWPDGRRKKIMPSEAQSDDQAFTSSQTLAVIDHIIRLSHELKIEQPPAVWPDVLPEKIYLPDLVKQHLRGGWDGNEWKDVAPVGPHQFYFRFIPPVLGVFDLPSKQKQVMYSIDPDKGGHLLVFGSAGSGKSVLLRSLATSLATTNNPEKVHIQIMDFGGQSMLKPLEKFPHVGTVATRLDVERAERLIQFSLDEVSKRNELLFSERVDNWQDYNSKVDPGKQLPAYYFIIDNFREVKRIFDVEYIKELTALVSGAAGNGIFLIIATTTPTDLPGDIFANVNSRITFYQADETEYYRIVGRPSETKIEEQISKGAVPGRGFLRGNPPLEFQAALPTAGITDNEQANNLADLAEAMNNKWKGPKPQKIESLPFHITLPDKFQAPTIQHTESIWTMLGKDYTSLAPIGFSIRNDGPYFIIGGVSPQSGKTTTLKTLVLGLSSLYSPDLAQFIFVDFHGRSLAAFRNIPHTLSYIGMKSELENAVEQLKEITNHRELEMDELYKKDPDSFDQMDMLRKWSQVIVVIDDYDNYASKTESERTDLGRAIINGSELGVSAVLSGNISELPRDYDDPLMQSSRKHGCGILLSGTEGIDQFNNARRPPGQPSAGLPPGRGYLIRRGNVELFQVAAYWDEGMDAEKALDAWVKRI